MVAPVRVTSSATRSMSLLSSMVSLVVVAVPEAPSAVRSSKVTSTGSASGVKPPSTPSVFVSICAGAGASGAGAMRAPAGAMRPSTGTTLLPPAGARLGLPVLGAAWLPDATLWLPAAGELGALGAGAATEALLVVFCPRPAASGVLAGFSLASTVAGITQAKAAESTNDKSRVLKFLCVCIVSSCIMCVMFARGCFALYIRTQQRGKAG